MKLMGRVSRNIDRFAGTHDTLLAPERRFNLAFEKDERFLEVVTVGRRSASRRNMPIHQAEPAGRISAGQNNRIRIADDAKVR